MNNRKEGKILALDMHPQSFGFVVFDGSGHIIDWGVRSFRHGINAVKIPMKMKLKLLIEEHWPRVVLVRQPAAGISRITTVLRKLASAYSISLRLSSGEALRHAFPNVNNKDELASRVAERIPALSSFLPPRRKPWKPEHYRISIFMAAALALAYLPAPGSQ